LQSFSLVRERDLSEGDISAGNLLVPIALVIAIAIAIAIATYLFSCGCLNKMRQVFQTALSL